MTCPFCDYSGPSHVLLDDGDAFVIEPLSPVTPGHLIVIPRRHVESFAEDPETSARVMRLASRIIGGFVPKFGGPDAQSLKACNVITSVGEAATQSVRHLHVHIVPRCEGDGLKLPWST